ncbi:MAG: TetR/AcrR family transcriptional regulator [Sterolibacteriaceae bacterium]|nr:TetR/AcrR family transcriptional regulator [Sterolibacteriaceae bacterium]
MGDSVKSAVRPAVKVPPGTLPFAAAAVGECEGRRPRGRPAGRCATRDDLVQAGIGIFTEQGFASTGIDAVLREVGVPKGSFYHYFASKEEFGLAVIDGYARHYDDKLARQFGDAGIAPLDRFGGFLVEARRGMRKHGFRKGCLVGNLGQEFGCAHEMFAKRLAAVLKGWQRVVGACLREAQAAGELAATADVDKLAKLFWIGWEGAVMRARLERSSRPLDIFMEFYLAQLRPT